MLELIVLGKIPGTHYQLTITTILALYLVVLSLTLVYMLLRTRVTKLMRDTRELMTIERISL